VICGYLILLKNINKSELAMYPGYDWFNIKMKLRHLWTLMQ